MFAWGLSVHPRDDGGRRRGGLRPEHLAPISYADLAARHPLGKRSCGCQDSYKEKQHPGVWVTKLKSLLSPTQGTTVRVITAIDQDKGRPRGIGYTIVSGKV